MNDSEETVDRTPPTDEELEAAVDELIEVARKKAIEECENGAGEGGRLTWRPDKATDEELERIEEGLKELRNRFEEIYSPRPEDFDELIKTMQSVEASMGHFEVAQGDAENVVNIGGEGEFSAIQTAANDLGEWRGKLRDNLVGNYLNPLYPAVVNTHGSLAGFLRQQAMVMKRIYERRRADAKHSAEEAVTAIEAINDSKGSDMTIFLAVVIAAGTLVTGLAPLAAGSGLAATLAGSSAIMGGTLAGPFVKDDKELPLGADTVEGVVDNLYEALNRSDETMQEEEDEVIKAMQNIDGLVYPMVNGPDFDKGNAMCPKYPDTSATSDPDALKDGFYNPFLIDGGDGGNDGGDDNGGGDGDDDGGGRGSYFGPNPPEDFDGSIHETGLQPLRAPERPV